MRLLQPVVQAEVRRMEFLPQIETLVALEDQYLLFGHGDLISRELDKREDGEE